MNLFRTPRRRSQRGAGAAAMFLAAIVGGCAGLGREAERVDLPPDAPEVETVLADLAANAAAIEDFRGGGTFIIESPDLSGTKKFRGTVRFRRPADLYVEGNERLTRIALFRLISVGPQFLMEFPRSEEQNFYQLEGERFEDVPFSVSPSDIAREMFFPEDWPELPRRQVRMLEYDSERETAVLLVGPRNAPRRMLEVVRVDPEAPTWVTGKNTRLDEHGNVLAITTLTDYHTLDGIVFPSEVDAYFPTEATRMTFRMRGIRPNTGLPDEMFDIEQRARDLGLLAAHADG